MGLIIIQSLVPTGVSTDFIDGTSNNTVIGTDWSINRFH